MDLSKAFDTINRDLYEQILKAYGFSNESLDVTLSTLNNEQKKNYYYYYLLYTILIYKKDSTRQPNKFRPITLENVTLKILTSALRNNVYQFLRPNNQIETYTKKSFDNPLNGVGIGVGV